MKDHTRRGIRDSCVCCLPHRDNAAAWASPGRHGMSGAWQFLAHFLPYLYDIWLHHMQAGNLRHIHHRHGKAIAIGKSGGDRGRSSQ